MFRRVVVVLSLLLTSGFTVLTHGPNFNVSFNPGDGAQVGQDVTIHIHVESNNPGATKINPNCGGVSKGETPEVDFESVWHTGDCSEGNVNITICTKASDDPQWQDPNCKNFGYNLTSKPGPSHSPGGQAEVGTVVNIHIKVDSPNPGATKINVPCGDLSHLELTEVEFDTKWNTSGCSAGTFKIWVYSRSKDDPNWENPTTTQANYTLTQTQPQQVPEVELWADDGSITKGGCTTLHWRTTGADNVVLDENPVKKNDDIQVCPPVTVQYRIKATNLSGTATRNVSVVVKPVKVPDGGKVVDNFNNKDVINIGGNIYIIIDEERRHVPNPDTLDALGLTRNMINNKGFSDTELSTIPKGPDIPDVNIDPQGFEDFKDQYFPNTKPIFTPQPKQTQGNGGEPDGNCPASPAKLKPGNIAVVIGTDLNLRPSPSVDNTPIKIIPVSSYVTIIAGPKCNGGTRWFEVGYQGSDGWAAEVGTGGTYHMIPNSQPIPKPKVTSNPKPTICNILSFAVSNSGIGVWGNCPNNAAHIRILIDGNEVAESTTSPLMKDWNGVGYGSHTIRAEVKAGGDKWTEAVWEEKNYNLVEAPQVKPSTDEPQQDWSKFKDPNADLTKPEEPMIQKAFCSTLPFFCPGDVDSRQRPFEEKQCTWYAAGRRPDVLNWLPDYGADAKNWIGFAEEAGIPTTTDIKNVKVGDLVVLQPGIHSANAIHGHVAYVEWADPVNNKIYISEYNGLKTEAYSERWLTIVNGMSFIQQRVLPPLDTSSPQEKSQSATSQPSSDESLLEKLLKFLKIK